MLLREIRTDLADPAERGHAIGQAFADEIRGAVMAYDGFFRSAGVVEADVREVTDQAAEALAVWDPPATAELAGVARGAGLPLTSIVALNARTEILGRAPDLPQVSECSTVAMVGHGPPRTLQTWDWYPSLAHVGVLVEHPSATGGVKTFTEPGILAKIGLNRAGLGLHFNILHHRDDGKPGGVPVHVVAARVLRECRTLPEALDLVRSAPLSASTVLTVVTWDGRASDATCLELSPAGVAVVPAEDGFRWHTNHFLDPVLAEGEASEDDGTTWRRGDHLVARRADLATAPDAVRRAEAMCGPAGATAPVNVRFAEDAPELERWGTLLTIALDLDAAELDLSPTVPAEFAAGRRRF